VGCLFLGYSILNATLQLDIAGDDITEHLISLLNESGACSWNTVTREETILMKEHWCMVEERTKKGTDNLKSQHITPSGKKYVFRTKKFECLEIIFQPKYFGRTSGQFYILPFYYPVFSVEGIHK
jgi:actin-related protein